MGNHELWYKVQDGQGFVEITLFVERFEEGCDLSETLVAQQEGVFDTMEEARPMIEYIEKTGANIEYVTVESQYK